MEFPAKRWIRPTAPEAGRASGHGGGRPATDGALVDRLLAARGVVTKEDREAFLGPLLKHVQSPSDMHGMREAAATICDAVRRKKRIAIYGDYDVDGIMATAIVWHMLRAIAPDLAVRTYIPHRIEEGYGLNADALRALKDEGIDLVVTVDCGVSAVDEAAFAREIGLELVVTDHHELKASGAVPLAHAVVHPRLPADQRFGELCGAGVAWKLAWQVAETFSGSKTLPEALRNRLLSLLPLAAIGTIADVVPLLGENRVIVARGLAVIGHTGIVGLDELLASARLEPARIDSEAIAFRLAPRINACGRMGHAEDAVELFTTADRRRSAEIAAKLDELNDLRRKDDKTILEEAIAKLEARTGGRAPRGIVLADERWNLGVVGIVCSKLVDRYACPAILITRNGDIYKGSGRSVPGIELHRVLEQCSAHLLGFGGHAMAAGVKIDGASIEAFASAFEEACDALLPPAAEQRPQLEIDCECTLGDLDLSTVGQITRLAPFGRSNRRPTVLVEDVEVTQVRAIGKTGTHLEVKVRQPQGGQMQFLRMQWWNGAEHAELLARGTRIDVVVEPALNEFRGIAEVEAKVVDFRIRAAQAVGGVR
ncbi:MAG: single-stranded-DNA-specific exonuclease RecJ [Planctomycetaceae bacterium]|nr:single-stranded-DNA-specific exonuclease RecJ [Planctomycetaceae bacterium]